jgi:hypothetical protein
MSPLVSSCVPPALVLCTEQSHTADVLTCRWLPARSAWPLASPSACSAAGRCSPAPMRVYVLGEHVETATTISLVVVTATAVAPNRPSALTAP